MSVLKKKQLTARSITKKALDLGYIKKDGYSTLAKGQKVLHDWGIEEGENPTYIDRMPWNQYIRYTLNNTAAEKHKTSSYWSLKNKGEVFKVIDEAKAANKVKIIHTGLNWYTGFNQGGGFRFPWLITKWVGYKVGSHAFLLVDYDLDYNGKEVFVFKNSYGKNWGAKSYFYIEIDFFMKNHLGMFANLDFKIDTGLFLQKYDGKNVKGKDKSTIYHIQKGKKKPYMDWVAYLSFEGLRRGFTEVDQEVLDSVEKGDKMDFKKSYYYPFLSSHSYHASVPTDLFYP